MAQYPLSARRVLPGVLALTLLLTGAGAAHAAPPDVPSEPLILSVISASGTGCPPGGSQISPWLDKTGFYIYSDFGVEIGPGSGSGEVKKKCQIVLDVRVPSGFRFAITESVHHGTASLAATARARVMTNFFHIDSPVQPLTILNLTGPYEDTWTQVTVVGDSPVWSACGKSHPLVTNTELRLSPGASDPKKHPSFVTLGALDELPPTSYRVAWQRCT